MKIFSQVKFMGGIKYQLEWWNYGAIAIPLKLKFQSMLVIVVFLDECKNKRLNAIHKRDSKNLIKNYRPISLFPVFRKVSERLIFNSLFIYFIQNKLLTECQSGFILGDSCVAKFLSVTDETYKSFD